MNPTEKTLGKLEFVLLSYDHSIAIIKRTEYDRIIKEKDLKLVNTTTDKLEKELYYHVSKNISYDMCLIRAVESVLIWFDLFPDPDNLSNPEDGLMQYVKGGPNLPLFLVGQQYVGLVAPRVED